MLKSSCTVQPGDDSIDLNLYTPAIERTPAQLMGDLWFGLSAAQKYAVNEEYTNRWGSYPTHALHFAVYASGMPSAMDYRFDAAEGDDGGDADEWRPVSLGGWSYREQDADDVGPGDNRVLLGVFHPVGEDDADVSLDSVPAVRDFYYVDGGRAVEIARDFANRDGEVDVYVVPCLPLQAGVTPGVGACEHLPYGGGRVWTAEFERAANQAGPFGVTEPMGASTLFHVDYSLKFTVKFLGSAWADDAERKVSVPREVQEPWVPRCEVHSTGVGAHLFWPEITVAGGACDSDVLAPVTVNIVNDGAHNRASQPSHGRTDRLLVYVSGGRSDGLDLVRLRQGGIAHGPSAFGRKGLLERRLALPYASGDRSVAQIVVPPDLADANGEAWLLFYSCGADAAGRPRHLGTIGRCPFAGRAAAGIRVFDVLPPPAFAVRVRWTDKAGLVANSRDPVCQGTECPDAASLPFLRLDEVSYEEKAASCLVDTWNGGIDDLTYWPDRVIRCDTNDFDTANLVVRNNTGYERSLVFYVTGGVGDGLDLVSVRRGSSVAWSAAEEAGKVGLSREIVTLPAGGEGRVAVDYGMVDDYGEALVLAYECPSRDDCPGGSLAGDDRVFDVDRRPLFQAIVGLYPKRDVIITPRELSLLEDGEPGEYSVVLASVPRGVVQVKAVAHPSGHLGLQGLDANGSLSFGLDDWDQARIVSVRALHDDDTDDDVAQVRHTISGANYGDAGLCPDGCPVNVSITDDDAPGVIVSTNSVEMREDGSGSYLVRLRTLPKGNVTITLTATPSAGAVRLSGTTLTFTPGNWKQAQRVTLTGVNDSGFRLSPRKLVIAHTAAGGGYDGVSIGDVDVIVYDVGNTPSVAVSDWSVDAVLGQRAAYYLSLNSGPSGVVTVEMFASDSAVATVTSRVTFTPDNWATPQAVSVVGRSLGHTMITHRVSGGGYDDVRVSNVYVNVESAVVKGVTLSTSALTIVAGAQDTYQVALTAQPSGPVTLTPTSSETKTVKVSPSSATFTAANWNQPQTFTVRGLSVSRATISHAAAGGGYDAVAVGSVSVAVIKAGKPGGGLGGVHTSRVLDDGDFSQWWQPTPVPALTLGDSAGFSLPWPAAPQPSWLFAPQPLARNVAWNGAASAIPLGHDWMSGDYRGEPPRPVATSEGWDWFGDYFDVYLTGVTPGARVWVYRLVPDAGGTVTTCDTDEHSALTIAAGWVAKNKTTHTFSNLQISEVLFDEGPNYVCAVDAAGKGWATPAVLTVHQPLDTYRIGLRITNVDKGGMSALPDAGFKVIDGQHYDGAYRSPWSMPQYRGTGITPARYLTKTSGELRRCYDGATAKTGKSGVGFGLRQVGCDWAPHDSNVAGKVGMVPVTGNEPAVQVPGDDVEFRVGFHPHQFSGREKERFAVFWGPVDLWLLGAPGIEASDYVIHQSHLEGFQRRVITQADLDVDGYYSLMISRESANAQGHTFVAVVPCNEDYLGIGVPGTPLHRNQRALPDCSNQLTSEVDFDSTTTERTAWRQAWQQHDVTKGLGMSCRVAVTVVKDDSSPPRVTARSYEVLCDNDLKSVSRDDMEDCDSKLRGAETVQQSVTYTDLRCGWGPLTPYDSDAYWGDTKYNAARSVYGFVIDWYLDSGSRGAKRAGCNADLLRYRLTRDGQRVSVIEGSDPVGTRYWRLGTAPENDVDCHAPAGVDSVDVNFFAAKADGGWVSRWRDWHGNQAAHFALYASGLTKGHESGDGLQTDGWRRIALGSWDWSDGRINLDGGLRQPLGMAFPLGASGVTVSDGAGGGGIEIAQVRDFYNGKSFSVSRDMANANGVVRLYVVPCLPNYAYRHPTVSYCRDLARGAGSGYELEFRQADYRDGKQHGSDAGPFGLSTTASKQVLHYSYVVTVTFDEMLDGDRPVSIPYRDETPQKFCEVVRGADGVWLEATYSGGACDSDGLKPVVVRFFNNGDDDSVLALYATGGRSKGYDLVQAVQAEPGMDTASELGRLGLLERRPIFVAKGRAAHVLISPDLADAGGDVWLLAYQCDGNGRARLCPRGSRGKPGTITGYRMRPAVSFAVKVRFTDKAGLQHTDLDPICQGANCAPPVPQVLREAPPEDVGDGVCGVVAYDGGRLWPDRIVRGGACAPETSEPLNVKISQPAGAGHLVVFATGGSDFEPLDLSEVQVNRGGIAVGEAGLRRVHLSTTGSILVDPNMADDEGEVLLLGYLCSDSSDAMAGTALTDCPAGVEAGSSDFVVPRRPLFQILVEYKADDIVFTEIAVCKGDDCLQAYPLRRQSLPDDGACRVTADLSVGRTYWPTGVVTGGACEREVLRDFELPLAVPQGSDGDKFVAYVTGGRTDGFGNVQVRSATHATPNAGGASPSLDRSIYVPPPEISASQRVSYSYGQLHNALRQKPWARDGLAPVESALMQAVLSLSTEPWAVRLVEMPFLDSVDYLDYLTVRALDRRGGDSSITDAILSHPDFAGGITDADRLLVVGAARHVDADAARSRLDAGAYSAERRVLTTVRGNRLAVTVARLREDARKHPGALQLVLDSVDSLETMMDEDFPSSEVYLFIDGGMFSNPRVSGYNFRYGVSSPSGDERYFLMAVNPDHGKFRWTLIHEVAHYYWESAGREPDQALWLTEGMAELVVAAYGPDLDIEGSGLRRDDAGQVELCAGVSLSMLATGQHDRTCPYYLGQELFVELREKLGVAAFRDGIRKLYATLQSRRDIPGEPWIDHVRAAFAGSPTARGIIDRHWGAGQTPAVGVPVPVVGADGTLGRLGLHTAYDLESRYGAPALLRISPDYANYNGEVWVLLYRCRSEHGDDGCPKLGERPRNGYDLPKGPDFAVKVRFTEASGLVGADLRDVCNGTECAERRPWLRAALPAVSSGCSVELGNYERWPDHVVQGGGCDFWGSTQGEVVFRASKDVSAEQRLVVYATGGGSAELGQMPVYGRLDSPAAFSGDAPVAGGAPVALGKKGLQRYDISLRPGAFTQVFPDRAMADGAGQVWMFAYRCVDGVCPQPGGNPLWPSYNIQQRPDFVIRPTFRSASVYAKSTLEDDGCPNAVCQLTAVFRNADGHSMPGKVKFTTSGGGFGTLGSRLFDATTQRGNDGVYGATVALYLPAGGSFVDVTAEFYDGTKLRRRVGSRTNVSPADFLVEKVLRCPGDARSCHGAGLQSVQHLSPGDYFKLTVRGYDAGGNEVFPNGRPQPTFAQCRDRTVSAPWASFWFKSASLRSYGYGVDHLADRGYVGCAARVSPSAGPGRQHLELQYPLDAAKPKVSHRTIVVLGPPTSWAFSVAPAEDESLFVGETYDFTLRAVDAYRNPPKSGSGCFSVSVLDGDGLPLASQGDGDSLGGLGDGVACANELDGNGQFAFTYTVGSPNDSVRVMLVRDAAGEVVVRREWKVGNPAPPSALVLRAMSLRAEYDADSGLTTLSWAPSRHALGGHYVAVYALDDDGRQQGYPVCSRRYYSRDDRTYVCRGLADGVSYRLFVMSYADDDWDSSYDVAELDFVAE